MSNKAVRQHSPSPMTNDLIAIRARTAAVYERHADRWDRERPRVLFERGWLDRFCATLPAGGSVLDLGCGAGEPIAAYLVAQGFAVTGLDQSAAMLALFRARFPDLPAVKADMATLDLGRCFDGVIGWDSFFHLSPAQQRSALPLIAGHVAPGGALMLTVGPRAGEVTGTVAGEAVYHASLDPSDYAAILHQKRFAQATVTGRRPELRRSLDPVCGAVVDRGAPFSNHPHQTAKLLIESHIAQSRHARIT